MLLRPFLNDATSCASYLFGCGTQAKLAVVDPHAELVDGYNPRRGRISIAARRKSSPIATFRRKSCGSPSRSSSQVPIKTEDESGDDCERPARPAHARAREDDRKNWQHARRDRSDHSGEEAHSEQDDHERLRFNAVSRSWATLGGVKSTPGRNVETQRPLRSKMRASAEWIFELPVSGVATT
jgi:hypothetical protein